MRATDKQKQIKITDMNRPTQTKQQIKATNKQTTVALIKTAAGKNCDVDAFVRFLLNRQVWESFNEECSDQYSRSIWLRTKPRQLLHTSKPQ